MTPLPDIDGVDELVEIGRGGFGVVYRGVERRYGRHVAVKLLTATLDEHAAARFERELQTMGTVTGHPNIVTVFRDGHLASGQPYLVMEFLPGGSMQDRIQSAGPMAWREAARAGAKLASALSAAHDVGIVHRDIKPDNVFQSANGEPKLGDFGIAHLDGAFQTRSGTITASLAHAPVEVIEGQVGNVLSDVYSLASTIYTLVAGEPPFGSAKDSSVVTLLGKIATQSAPELQLGTEADQFRAVLRAGLSKRLEDRPQTAREFAELLHKSLAVEQSVAAPSPGSPAPPQAASRQPPASPTPTPVRPTKLEQPAVDPSPTTRSRPWRAVAAALVVVAIGATAFLLLRPGAAAPAVAALAPQALQNNPFVITTSGFADVSDPDLAALSLLDNGTAITTVRGDAPGLFGASQTADLCDRQAIVQELDRHLDRSRAWASALGTTSASIDTRMAEFASVFIKHDLVVEIVGFSVDTDDTVRQTVVLASGTSVLVDQFGVPRVRCLDGSPLNPPPAPEGLDRPSEVISIVPGTRMLELDVDDVDAPGTFLLPVGAEQQGTPPPPVATLSEPEPLPTVAPGTLERIAVAAGPVTVDLGPNQMRFVLSEPHQVLSREAHLLIYFDDPNGEVDIFRPFASDLGVELETVDDVVNYLVTDTRFGQVRELNWVLYNGFFTRAFQIEPESFLAFTATPTAEGGVGWQTPPLLRLWVVDAPNGPVIVTAESLDEDLVNFDETTAVALQVLTSMHFDGG